MTMDAKAMKELADQLGVEIGGEHLAFFEILKDAIACRIAYAIQKEGDEHLPDRLAVLFKVDKIVTKMLEDTKAAQDMATEERAGVPIGKRMVS